MSVGFWNERVPALLDEIIGMYRTAGRSLARLTDDELDANFVETVEAYITDPRTPARFCAVNNVAAEYVLRRRGAPFERLWPFQEGRVTINQRFRGVIVLPNNLIHMVEGLPMVVLAFGRFGTIPAAGIIFTISDEDPPNWNKLTGPGLQLANKCWRKERDERQAEFRWLLGLSTDSVGHVIHLDDARARRAAG